MKLGSVSCAVVVLGALLILPFGTAFAQATPTSTATSTTTATPTATATTAISQFCQFQDCAPSGTAVDCRTAGQGSPPPFGISGGNFNSTGKAGCCAATLGAAVQDSRATLYALSANHVLARTSNTSVAAAKGELIEQPGLLDLGCFQAPGDTVATLSKWVPLNFSGVNTVDAAIARFANGGMDPTGTISNVGTISATTFPVTSLFDGMYVMKMGRSSCLTLGQVMAFEATGKVRYPAMPGSLGRGTALFTHQIIIVGAATQSPGAAPPAFSQPGDSGALVLNAPAFPSGSPDCPQAIGLIFATNGSGTLTAVNPIDRVLSALRVSLVGACSGPIVTGLANPGADAAEAGGPSAALRASQERVRAVKESYARRLLKLDEVVAVGIGAGDDPDHAGLAVFVEGDERQARAKIPARIAGVPVKIRHSGGFHVSQACGTSPFTPP